MGELIYSGKISGPTQFGDLGGELAQKILASPLLSRSVKEFIPANRGHATVVGMAVYNQDLSGSSVFVADSVALPLPQLAYLGQALNLTELKKLLVSGVGLREGCCVALDVPSEMEAAQSLATEVKVLLTELAISNPLVFLIPNNIGKTFGNWLTDWGKLKTPVVVLDEVLPRGGHFVQVGNWVKGVIPLSFYGMGPGSR